MSIHTQSKAETSVFRALPEITMFMGRGTFFLEILM